MTIACGIQFVTVIIKSNHLQVFLLILIIGIVTNLKHGGLETNPKHDGEKRE